MKKILISILIISIVAFTTEEPFNMTWFGVGMVTYILLSDCVKYIIGKFVNKSQTTPKDNE